MARERGTATTAVAHLRAVVYQQPPCLIHAAEAVRGTSVEPCGGKAPRSASQIAIETGIPAANNLNNAEQPFS